MLKKLNLTQNIWLGGSSPKIFSLLNKVKSTKEESSLKILLYFELWQNGASSFKELFMMFFKSKNLFEW